MSTSLRGSAGRLTRAARAGDKVAVLKVAGICVGAGVGVWVVLGWIFWSLSLSLFLSCTQYIRRERSEECYILGYGVDGFGCILSLLLLLYIDACSQLERFDWLICLHGFWKLHSDIAFGLMGLHLIVSTVHVVYIEVDVFINDVGYDIIVEPEPLIGRQQTTTYCT